MFIRVKHISGKEYAYAVENTWKKGRSRQKVKKYLGPVVRFDKVDERSFAEWKDVELEHYIDTTPVKKLMRELIRHTLMQYGFTGRPLRRERITVDLRKGVLRGEKQAVLAVGEGFLSKDSMRALLHVKPVEEERRGSHLASLFLRAGIPTEKLLFILIYRKINNI